VRNNVQPSQTRPAHAAIRCIPNGVAMQRWAFSVFQKTFGQEGGTTGLDDAFAARGVECRRVALSRSTRVDQLQR
jgi:hypothetical protein